MMQSMTGYGRSEVHNDALHLIVEARSVNHRYLDVVIRYPRPYAPLESRMKQLVGTHFARGRIEITIAQPANGSERRALALDHTLAQQYYQALQHLQESLHLPGTIDLGLIVSMRDLFKVEEANDDIETVWELMAPGLEEALQALKTMRQEEGAFLCHDMQERIRIIARHVDTIRQRVPQVVREYRERLQQRVQDLFQQFTLEPDRLNQEAILLAERTDVTEELTRLEAHIQALTRLLASSEAMGRKSEFLLQEIHREVNTVASKCNDATIAQDVVEIKSELERIREQLQNIE